MRASFSPEQAALLGPYVTNVERPIFALHNLPEEVVAVLFAYYSRSRDSLRQNLLRLIQDRDLDLSERLTWAGADRDELALARQKAKEFHEKWVVGYGHASVAEHAVAHLALEDVSIVASKLVEDTRLASFTEKSTRYVQFDREKFYREPRLMASAQAGRYQEACRFLLDAYTRLTEPVVAAIKKELPRGEAQTERGYEAACRAQTCDILRYILPAATLTNIGMTINGRLLEHLIRKLLSHPLAEAGTIGAALKQEARQVIPTLLKYAERNAYLAETSVTIRDAAERIFAGLTPEAAPSVSLVRWPEDAEEQLVAAILYGAARHPWRQVQSRVATLLPEEKAGVIDEYLKRRGAHDQPLRALEHLSYTFDILLDFGAFRDIQRHRLVTQLPQESTAVHGYSTPPEIARYGLAADYEACMIRAREAYEALRADFPDEAQYVLPLAYKKRVLFTWNLREMFHFVELRSARQGHVSYRQIAQQVFRELERVQPLLARYMRVDLADYGLARG
ncbi:MAG: FAD-dependent thymidylate synthase [candidate division NC10 bacterium]|nr:FAD-dependent thymidylate synthase [candidate division NC10 bacterium]